MLPKFTCLYVSIPLMNGAMPLISGVSTQNYSTVKAELKSFLKELGVLKYWDIDIKVNQMVRHLA